ncbi:MAG: P-loop NTPase fold protein, partial [Fibrobacterota bacterium]
MWSDNETIQDLLGFQVHADLIKKVIIDKSILPMTVGVFGDWGGGKTSIMRMLERDLSPDNYSAPEEKAKYEKIACLYFNGWVFEGYEDAKTAILSSVLLSLSEHKRFGPKVRDKAMELFKSVDLMKAAKFGLKEIAIPSVAAYLTGGMSLIPEITKSLKALAGIKNEKDRDESAPADADADKIKVPWDDFIKKSNSVETMIDVKSFRCRFKKMLDDCDIDNLVVLIDDLDRCSPERIIDNLEAIKLFLNVEGTAFVIGADRRIIRHAINYRYSKEGIM